MSIATGTIAHHGSGAEVAAASNRSASSRSKKSNDGFCDLSRRILGGAVGSSPNWLATSSVFASNATSSLIVLFETPSFLRLALNVSISFVPIWSRRR